MIRVRNNPIGQKDYSLCLIFSVSCLRFLQQFISYLSNRIVRNLFFWIVLCTLVGFQLASNNNNIIVNVLFRLAYVVAFGVPIYLNNLWAIPHFLYKKRRRLYLLLFPTIWIVGTFFVQHVHYQMELFFPTDYKDFALASNTYVSQFLHLGSLMIVFSMAKFSTDSFVRQRKLENLEREKLQSELENLRNQIDPHFLFNALNTVFSLSQHMDPKTPSAISDLSSILRYVIYDSQTPLMQLKDEIDFVKNYLDFMSLRKESHFVVDLNISGEIRGYEIPPLLLLPLIENAFKHGVDESTHEASLFIEINVSDDVLYFKCINSKPNGNKPMGKGIGLENIQKRLELIYADQAVLYIFDHDSTFETRLSIKL